jgi:hypothetical protein
MWLEIVGRKNLGTNAKPLTGVKLAYEGQPFEVSDGTWLQSPMGRWKVRRRPEYGSFVELVGKGAPSSDLIELPGIDGQKANEDEDEANWLETELQKLDTTGRDYFYTHLIQQEIPMWLGTIREGGLVETSEVYWLIKRRGFNKEEAAKFKALAAWLNARAAEIRRRGA